MAKVSVGLRGWRFDESALFTDDGDWRSLDEMPEDARRRLVRLRELVEQPCDVCYLVGDGGDAAQAAIVYGEPMDEVLLCGDHEADFLYWFRETGGTDLAGEAGFADAFHEWIADGERAPAGYGGMDHVATEPADLPDLPSAEEVQERMLDELDFEPTRYDLREYVGDDEAPPRPDPDAGSFLSDGEPPAGDDTGRDQAEGDDDTADDEADEGGDDGVAPDDSAAADDDPDRSDVDLDTDYPTR